ncbi:hypothetical protein Hanom_Chr03g00261071 [Helianthus anomalus]
MAAFPGTSRAIVGISPLNRPLTPPSDLSTCLATSIGPPYFTAAVIVAAGLPVTAPASALWACNLHSKVQTSERLSMDLRFESDYVF